MYDANRNDDDNNNNNNKFVSTDAVTLVCTDYGSTKLQARILQCLRQCVDGNLVA
jgi:hypothetical protein